MKGMFDKILENKGSSEYKGDRNVDAELEEMLKGLKTNIKIVGCGGGGCNTVSRIIEEGHQGAEMYVANTDAQHLLTIRGAHKMLLGPRITKGLGSGALPQVGEEAAREVQEKITEKLSQANVVFIACGLGGGTGTGSAPVFAKIAKELGALTVVFATLPFKAEGSMRMDNALKGLERLKRVADTTVVVPNERVLELAPNLPLSSAFRLADEVLSTAIVGLNDVITKPGLVNLDFNDMRTIMKNGGMGMIGFGESDGDRRAEEAIEEAINSPLLSVDLSTSRGIMVNVVGGSDMSVGEAEKVAEIVHSKVGAGSRIIWGASVDPTVGKSIKVLLVATGLEMRGVGSPSNTKNASVEMVS